ncbi:MAG: hypothetical protein H6Q04_1300 [Acidobacteria bacterium]|nr:hypothetical protein [Acidobacteriota bacterium]
MPHKTLFHELAHMLLHQDEQKTLKSVQEAEAETVALLCCETLGLPGADYTRGYIQEWLRGYKLTEESSQRILKAAETIITAGGIVKLRDYRLS